MDTLAYAPPFNTMPITEDTWTTISPTSAVQRAPSISSTTSSIGRKERPDSLIFKGSDGPLILGLALVDFNHSVSFFILTTVLILITFY